MDAGIECGHGVETGFEDVGHDHATPHECAAEFPILLPARHRLRDPEIVQFQATRP